ncbi:patatin-like phospholipase family protein [Streptomyces sp. CA-210063]|uniref:patatin-like phospholipase family protein n=1 Tax=Streptomyces sp. CA-210063 TaxID=2801029 RepID=UPI00214BD4D5|nr:patatin-like phospholipase family protein [Streptomyces sp. CA-210063]UUU31857.1 patatin-like phospholipase family protein [Streptomyces sp. CA-210063]
MTETAPPRTKRSLILAGGGLKVAFQAGVLQVWLDEAGLVFDHVDGASGGSFNLAMMCQGMSGTEIADAWRRTEPLAGVSVNVRQLARPAFAESLFTLDAYRANVFPEWGLDWQKIRSSSLDATFNVFNVTRQKLEVLPPARMSEDFLVACVSLPMWFPPVRIDGDTYIDPVYVTDANLEEAIARGADEIWVVWTVSERGEWRPGFVAEYFQIIEAAANGTFRRTVDRVERNNAAIASGLTGEFGRHIELHVLRAEVPLHYLINLSGDRLREAVNRGAETARSWCAERKIPLAGPLPQPLRETPVSLRFTEDMRGRVTVGPDGPPVRLSVHLTIATDSIERFTGDPRHTASVTGQVHCPAFGGVRELTDGTFELFVDDGDPTRKEMRYRLHFTDDQDKPLTLVGVKTVESGNPLRMWSETTTLRTQVLRGHVPEGEETIGEMVAEGVIRLGVPDLLRELTTFRVEGSSPAARAAALARFGMLFLGKLWDVYARPLLHPAPF